MRNTLQHLLEALLRKVEDMLVRRMHYVVGVADLTDEQRAQLTV